MTVRWRCTLCGQCCRAYTPLVLPEDVRRIQRALRWPMSRFITFYTVEDFGGSLDGHSAQHAVVTKDGRLVMCLSRVGLPDGGAGCVFLDGNLCSVHESRPYVCRQYPFEPDETTSRRGAFRLMDDPCFGNHATDATVDEPPIRRNFYAFERAQARYLAAVRDWNDAPDAGAKSIDDFLARVGLTWN